MTRCDGWFGAIFCVKDYHLTIDVSNFKKIVMEVLSAILAGGSGSFGEPARLIGYKGEI